MEQAPLATAWLVPLIAIAFGGALWAFGSRLARHAIALIGFAGGVPAGATIASALALEWFPPVAGAVAGALIGLLLAKVAYRLVLACGVSVAATMLGCILATALVDRGLLVEESRRATVAMQARTDELAQTMARELAADPEIRASANELRARVAEFWTSLESPERTLVLASGATAALVGFLLGLLVPSVAEIAATSLLGSLFIAWGLGHALGGSGPSPSAWLLATTVLTLVGAAVQGLSSNRRQPQAPSAPPTTAAA